MTPELFLVLTSASSHGIVSVQSRCRAVHVKNTSPVSACVQTSYDLSTGGSVPRLSTAFVFMWKLPTDPGADEDSRRDDERSCEKQKLSVLQFDVC